jgi:hypothetical protein
MTENLAFKEKQSVALLQARMKTAALRPSAASSTSADAVV